MIHTKCSYRQWGNLFPIVYKAYEIEEKGTKFKLVGDDEERNSHKRKESFELMNAW